jgi:hypothetical protein
MSSFKTWFVIGIGFQKLFEVDVLGFQIELCCRYFGLFMAWRLFGLLYERLGDFFPNLLVTLKIKRKKLPRVVLRRRHDTHHNDSQHNDSQHNDSQHNDSQHNDSQHNDSQHNDTHHNDGQHNDTQHSNIKIRYKALQQHSA